MNDAPTDPPNRYRRPSIRWFTRRAYWSVALVVIVVQTLASRAEIPNRNAPLRLLTTTPLPGFSGDLDHFSVDLKGERIFLAAEEHKTVEVFDLLSGARLHSITGIAHPLMMVYLPETNCLVVTDGGPSEDQPGAVELVDCQSYQIIQRIELPPGVDHAVFNPVDHCYYVESGSATREPEHHLLNVIDLKTFSRIDKLALPGQAQEAMAIDRAGKKLYVNLTGTDEVGVVDLERRELIARWHLPGVSNAHGIGLDEEHRRLFVASRTPAKFIVFDLDSGRVGTALPCVGVNSDLWFDAARERIYVTGSEATSVFQQRDADRYELLADVPTAYRAKSSVFVRDLDRLYVAVSGKGKPDAKLELRIYKVE